METKMLNFIKLNPVRSIMYFSAILVVVIALLFAQAGFKAASNKEVAYKTAVDKYQFTVDSLKRENTILSITGSQLRLDLIACQDSIGLLKANTNKKMSKENFKKLFKFDQLQDRYRDCKKHPAQVKYINGWFMRIMGSDL